MIRILFMLILLIALVLGGEWMFSNQGMMTINIADITIEISIAFAIMVAGAACILFTLTMLLLWQLLQWPERRRARKRYRTLSRGLTHLTQGFTALALNDDTGAAIALKKARAAMPNEPLPQLLTSQLLQRQGNHEESRGILRMLLKHDATALLATHTLIEQHMAHQEWTEAATLAESVRKQAPHDRWTTLTLIDLHAHRGNYAQMLELTEGWQFRSPLTKPERHHIAAIAHYLIAAREPEVHLQHNHLEQATHFAPEFIPATVQYVAMLLGERELKQARKLLLQAWDHAPLAIFIPLILSSLGGGSERQRERLLKPFMKLPLRTPHHLLLAQNFIQLGEFEKAKKEIEAALALEETRQACQMMADVERELRGSPAAAGWLARAMDAPKEEAWICDRCRHTQDIWTSHCQSCDTFDSLHYERPEARITSVEVAKA